ncbi:MAG TPA: response regulator transcription factor [Pedococcus sp.]|jgi:DNA-binding response OmpR family regulator|nr:response regulator transcription factor [Pedococcus sp.]
MSESGRVRVLLADDDADIRDLVRFKLSQAGYAVQAVCDGPAAWASFQDDPPHLVLLDVQMPGMSGIDVLRRIREGGATEVPVVLLSARSRDSDVDAGLAAGATEYLVKPFSPRALLAQIKGLAPLGDPSPVGI